MYPWTALPEALLLGMFLFLVQAASLRRGGWSGFAAAFGRVSRLTDQVR